MAGYVGPEGDLRLADLDFLGRSDDLRAAAERELRATASDGEPSGAAASDPSGSVRVSLDTRGRVTGVVVRSTWREHLRVGELADGLFTAYTAAVTTLLEAGARAKLLEAEAEAEAEAAAVSSMTYPPAWQAGGQRPDAAGAGDDRDWLDAIWRTLHDVQEELRRLDRPAGSGTESGGREATRNSPRRLFTLRVRGAGVVGVTGNVQRLAGADADEIGRDAAEVFQSVRWDG